MRNGCSSCALQGKCTTSNAKRLKFWEKERLLDAADAALKKHPDAMRQRKRLVEHPQTNRVVSADCIVDEARVRMVHSKQMDWFLPGVPPTGKPITAELVIIVEFRDGLMSAERIYWDHAAVLRQVGHAFKTGGTA